MASSDSTTLLIDHAGVKRAGARRQFLLVLAPTLSLISLMLDFLASLALACTGSVQIRAIYGICRLEQLA